MLTPCPSISTISGSPWRRQDSGGSHRPPTCWPRSTRPSWSTPPRGGTAGRGARYAKNCRILIDGLRALGFETLLPDALQAPIIVTVRMPADPKFNFETLYDRLSRRGYVIYPGKLTVADSFRIGCIGRLGEAEMRGALENIKQILGEMGVTRCAPAGR